MLGKRKPIRDKSAYLTYEELKKYVKERNIKTKNEYLENLRKDYKYNEKLIPYNPSTFYSKDIWKGWSIFLKNKIYKKSKYAVYYPYDECKEVIKKYNFKSKSDFINRISEIIKSDNRIPYNPYVVYRNEWVDWIEFLNTNNLNSSKIEYLSFDDARKVARSFNFKMQKEWRNIDIDILIKNSIPRKPERTYKNKGWIDWYDFLGINKKNKMSYGETIISTFLDRMSIKYKYNNSLKDCISLSKLRFDFYLPDYNTCIEYDGIQHFQPVSYFGGDVEFEKIKIRDKIKDDWCKVNGIKLLRINYKNDESEICKILSRLLKRKW